MSPLVELLFSATGDLRGDGQPEVPGATRITVLSHLVPLGVCEIPAAIPELRDSMDKLKKEVANGLAVLRLKEEAAVFNVLTVAHHELFRRPPGEQFCPIDDIFTAPAKQRRR